MTKEEFVNKWRHELAGLVLDGATTARTGADLALFCRQVMQKVDQRLAQIYADLTQPAAAGDGKAQPPARK